MFKMVRNTARSVARRTVAGFGSVKALWSTFAVAVLSFLVMGPAAAQDGPAAAITSALGGLASDLGGVIALLAAALAVIIIWAYVKRGSR